MQLLGKLRLFKQIAVDTSISRKRIKKAFGLLEVLIAIAISSIVLLGAMVVATKSIRFVRTNELQDLSNGVLIKSLEVSRSPVDFDLDSLLGASSGPNYYTLSNQDVDDGQGNTVERLRLTEQVGEFNEITECDTNSVYRVDLLEDQDVEQFADVNFRNAYQICNQIVISEVRTDNVRRVFEIKSIVVYRLFEEDVRSELISYRTEIVN
jgi:prepilin-type N-terminal cleavage/methylation domain-containing protein